ncbi:mitochondrial outer membrane protein porin of 34 kDa-like [Papaver somniferum]|uniref:mitochondrial outer membrane protein porin of 34 kDa-like n=1 Tax=Papaver somniferum TaxID=3469 RepID=UPI000E6FF676|nr:mitochondrial outer membrane protein porin of 34 kDa-like [Papaver somniferum]
MVPLNVDCSVPSVYRTFIKEAPYVSELDEKMSVTESKVVYGLHRVEIHRGSRRLELQYQHEYNSISTSIGLTENPMVNLSGVVGTPLLVLGTDLSYDTASGNLTKCNAGVRFANADLIAAVNFVDVCVFFNASYCHIESPLTYTDAGAKLAHSFSTNENTLTIGTQKALDQLTSVKASINNHGKSSALIQHEWRPRSIFTVLINQLTVN